MSENTISVIIAIDCYASGFGILLEFVSLSSARAQPTPTHRYSNILLLIHLLVLRRWLSLQFP
jgi:hypothetical protein